MLVLVFFQNNLKNKAIRDYNALKTDKIPVLLNQLVQKLLL